MFKRRSALPCRLTQLGERTRARRVGVELPHALHWLRELRHHRARRVFRALATYGVVAFALIEVYEPVMHALHLPEWTLTFIVLLLGIGFPVVSVLAWASTSGASTSATASNDARTHLTASPMGRRVELLLVGLGIFIAVPGLAYFLLWRGRRGFLSLVGLALLVAVSGLIYYLLRRGTEGSRRANAVGRTATIAVLPFADLSPLKDQEYFADGIAEEILNALAHVEGLHVPGRTSSFFFKGKRVRLSDIGRDLNVAAVLEGSVRKEGNRVRVAAQVVDVAGGYHLWSETYDRELTGIFVVQDEIARAVVDALRVELLPGGGPIVKEHRTTNPDAYNAYLLGRHFFDLGTSDALHRAVAAFEKALTFDPEYAPAWAWLSVAILNSDVYLSQAGSLADMDKAVQRATAAADKAVVLAPDLSDSWSARAWMRTCISWDWAGARADFGRALTLNGRSANILLRRGQLLAILGHLSDAIAITREVIGIDPLWPWAWYFLASYYNATGQPELARDAANRALEIAPEHIHAIRELGLSHLLTREPAAALAVFERHSWEVIRLAGTALAHHDLGNVEPEQNALDVLRERFADGEAYEIALIYAWRGDRDTALEWLDRAFIQRGGRGVSRLHFRAVKYEPLLRSIRDDPRYITLLRAMNLPVD
jgi:TolB-like protein/Flp pilus assembly protein TadD